jgi:WhiB family redox-sensing transcriptional regulator
MNEITLDSPAELLLTLSDDERRATLRRLRAELADRTANWRQLAACRGLDVEIFYAPEETRGGPAKREALRTAKRVCRHCPVIDECRVWALDTAEHYGIWGGLTAAERARRRR